MSDEELQKLMDAGKELPADDDSSVYQELFSVLESTDNDILPPGFAHRVTARLEENKSKDPVKRWIIGLMVAFIMIAAGTLVLILGTQLRVPGSGQVNLYAMFALALLPLALYYFIEKKQQRDPFTETD